MKGGAIMNSRYREEDRGRFDSYLIDRRWGIAVAYTDCDVVKLTQLYTEEDRTAVEEFAAQYDLPIDWEHRR
jgi:hypothetical protein